MKTFKFLLIGSGVLLILASLGTTISRWNTDNGNAFCDGAARRLKNFEAAVSDYETAKAERKSSYELAEYLKKVEFAKISSEGSTKMCADEQSMKSKWRTRKILLVVFGVVMLGIGLIIGRKKAA